MDELSRSIIESHRPELGARAHQLYLDFIHLGIALMPTRVYAVSYRVRTRHLWENDGAVSCEGTGSTLKEAIAACAKVHQQKNHTTDDWQVAWSATLTIRHGTWQRTLVVSPDRYHELVPGGLFDGDITTVSSTPLLRRA